MNELARTKEGNPDPRIAVALLLDTSESMSGDPIRELNDGFKTFCDEVGEEELARKRAEVIVISFGGVARVEIPFTQAEDLQPRQFTAGGGTPMAQALDIALDEIESQKQVHKAHGLDYFRPWLFLITDGEPTDDPADWQRVSARVRKAEANKRVVIFAVGVNQANLDKLRELTSQERPPVKLAGIKFSEMFEWLSHSLGTVSSSGSHGSDDASVAEQEQVALAPPGWTAV